MSNEPACPVSAFPRPLALVIERHENSPHALAYMLREAVDFISQAFPPVSGPELQSALAGDLLELAEAFEQC